MFNSPFLEEAAASRSERQQLDRLLRIAAPHERLLLAGIGALVLALVAWALFGSVVRTVTIDGVLIKPGYRHEVVSSEPGYLVEYLVDVGDQVAAGDPVARQSVPELDREMQILRDRVDLLQEEIRAGGGSALRSRLAAARSAMLQLEARRSAREALASHIEGEVMALGLTAGDYMPPGTAVVQVRTGAEGNTVQAVTQVGSRLAGSIRSGMEASIEVAVPNGGVRQLNAGVALVTPGPLPKWLAAERAPVVGEIHRVDVALDPRADALDLDGAACRIRVVLGQYRPIALLGSRLLGTNSVRHRDKRH